MAFEEQRSSPPVDPSAAPAPPGPTSLADAAKAAPNLPAPSSPTAFKKTFYKRQLPTPPATAFSSPEGRALFQEALAAGTMSGFFKLIEQYSTQDEPAFCGLSSLAMVLNALAIDPRRPWKGAWRWFHEKLLDCCLPLDYVAREGIVLSQAACLARCNGARVELQQFGQFTLEQFRDAVHQVCTSGEEHIVVSYSRRQFLQTGDGHYSPIGGYHAARDLVLILDVARFKYPPHWVPLAMLFEAMAHKDPVTGQARGFMRMSSQHMLDSLLFTLDIKAGRWHETEHFIRQQAIPLAKEVAASGASSPDEVVRRLVAATPVDGLESFLVVRAGSHSCARDRCVPHAARSQLLKELRNTALYQLVQQSLEELRAAGKLQEEEQQQPAAAVQQAQPPAAGSCCANQPPAEPPPYKAHLAEKLCLLLWLHRPGEWGVCWQCGEHQRRWEQLVDVSGVSIVETEATYLREQFAHIDAVLTSGDVESTCGSCNFKLDCTVHGHC